MTFSSLIGNDSARAFLQAVALQVNAPQVFLFTGPEGVGKQSFALAFAELLLGAKHVKKMQSSTHPDLLHFAPEGKTFMHPIASIRRILEEASYPPFEAPLKIYIIEDVERMLPSSSNALLKTLEEPHSHLRFILVSSHFEDILPTIASRCCRVPFYPIEESLLKQLVEKKEVAPEDPIRLCFIDLLRNHCCYPPSLGFIQDLAKLEKLLEKKTDSDKENGEFIHLMDNLLGDLLFWLRDLHLLQSTAIAPLFFASFREDLQKQLALGRLPTLEKASLFIEQARLGLQRSSKPRVVLENLFFQLSVK